MVAGEGPKPMKLPLHAGVLRKVYSGPLSTGCPLRVSASSEHSEKQSPCQLSALAVLRSPSLRWCRERGWGILLACRVELLLNQAMLSMSDKRPESQKQFSSLEVSN